MVFGYLRPVAVDAQMSKVLGHGLLITDIFVFLRGFSENSEHETSIRTNLWLRLRRVRINAG